MMSNINYKGANAPFFAGSKQLIFFLAAFLLLPAISKAQDSQIIDFFDQIALEKLGNAQGMAVLANLPTIHYEYFIASETSTLRNRIKLREKYDLVSQDSLAKQSEHLINLLNLRPSLDGLKQGDTLIVPIKLDLDVRAYSPFPRQYPAAKPFGKMIIVDKTLQIYAAYQDGDLIRWGMINTGSNENRTPNGRFNVNWKVPRRVSDLSPGVKDPKKSNELWVLRNVQNIYAERGIHFHQYFMPTSGPASHGCIRMPLGDADWMYKFTDAWTTNGKGDEVSCVGACRIEKQGTTVLVLGSDPKPNKKIRFFKKKDGKPELKMVALPANPYSVAAGSPQQRQYDSVRIAAERRQKAEERRRLAEEKRKQAEEAARQRRAQQRATPTRNRRAH